VLEQFSGRVGSTAPWSFEDWANTKRHPEVPGRKQLELHSDLPERSCLDAIEELEWYAQRSKIATFHKSSNPAVRPDLISADFLYPCCFHRNGGRIPPLPFSFVTS
jgi:hypothetical protein